MIYQTAGYTDGGAVRSCNQDSYSLLVAQCGSRQAALAVVCDGLGGLSQGELASAELVRAFGEWFRQSLPNLLRGGICVPELSAQWNAVVQQVHERLRWYGSKYGHMLATTVTVVLAAGGLYYLLHAGDCRAYLLCGGQEYRLTEDQTLAMREFREGRITEEQLRVDRRQHILLQCVGVGEVSPVFSTGEIPPQGVFLLCSDGFYHTLQPGELILALTGQRADAARVALENLGMACRCRGEEDNLTAAALLCLEAECIPTTQMGAGDTKEFRILSDDTHVHAGPIE